MHNTTVKLFADYEIKRRAQEEKDAEQRWASKGWPRRFSHFDIRIAPCKVIQESLRFRIPRCGFLIPCLWISDSTSMDSGFHNQQPGFWITIMVGFRIPLAECRIPKPWIPDSTDQNYLDSGFRITLHGAIRRFNGTFLFSHGHCDCGAFG